MDWRYLFTSFQGRINRAKFWVGTGALLAASIIALALDKVFGTTFDPVPVGLLFALVLCVSVYCALAIYAKRWHDRDKSGWWTLIALVPFIGIVWFVVEIGILEGTRGANQYGSDPLA
ncbi:MAG: DUF805 domain-containing protein [Pseudaminobacter sp.]